jgi:hypothetical protein
MDDAAAAAVAEADDLAAIVTAPVAVADADQATEAALNAELDALVVDTEPARASTAAASWHVPRSFERMLHQGAVTPSGSSGSLVVATPVPAAPLLGAVTCMLGSQGRGVDAAVPVARAPAGEVSTAVPPSEQDFTAKLRPAVGAE